MTIHVTGDPLTPMIALAGTLFSLGAAVRRRLH